MKKVIATFILFVGIFLVGHAQIPNWQWAKEIKGQKEDYARSIACDSKGNVVVIGDYLSDSLKTGSVTLHNMHPTGGPINQYNLSDIFVSKYDSLGNIIWSKSYGSDSADVVYSVTIDNADNIIVVGKFNGDTLHIGTHQLMKPSNQIAPNAFIFKLDNNGNELWAKGNKWHFNRRR